MDVCDVEIASCVEATFIALSLSLSLSLTHTHNSF